MHILLIVIAFLPFAMPRQTTKVTLPSSAIGSSNELIFHRYGPNEAEESAYIQASLHADELPGLLVSHHLIHLLDKADAENRIAKRITIVPFANPIGLGQNFLHSHLGRFSVSSGVNFNRAWIDVTTAVGKAIDGKLTASAAENVKLIRSAMLSEIDKLVINREDSVMKKELFKVASISDIVLDLHCDADAVMHMYTHDRLWPKYADLAVHLGSQCHLISPVSGGNPFDEACSCPWAALADKFPDFPIPMACEASTVELRGESEVYDSLAEKDAAAIFEFLTGRGYIRTTDGSTSVPVGVDKLSAPATPLDGVDMIEATAAGVLAWRVKAGDTVEAGQLLGEIVNIVDPDAARIPITSKTSGLVFGMRRHKLSVPGDIVIKVAGKESLTWRKGNLLTSR